MRALSQIYIPYIYSGGQSNLENKFWQDDSFCFIVVCKSYYTNGVGTKDSFDNLGFSIPLRGMLKMNGFPKNASPSNAGYWRICIPVFITIKKKKKDYK